MVVQRISNFSVIEGLMIAAVRTQNMSWVVISEPEAMDRQAQSAGADIVDRLSSDRVSSGTKITTLKRFF